MIFNSKYAFALLLLALSACGDSKPAPQDLKQFVQDHIQSEIMFGSTAPKVTDIRDCAFIEKNKSLYKCHVLLQLPDQSTDDRVIYFKQDDKKKWVLASRNG